MKYIGALEAVWRLLEFDVSGRQRTVVILPVHLPNDDILIFEDGKKEIRLGKNCGSKLKLYFNRSKTGEFSEDSTYY